MNTPKIQSPYSDKELRCGGRACAKCGFCRDWYWSPNGNGKRYTKRDDANCCYASPSRRYYFYGPYYHLNAAVALALPAAVPLLFAAAGGPLLFLATTNLVCECNDNGD